MDEDGLLISINEDGECKIVDPSESFEVTITFDSEEERDNFCCFMKSEEMSEAFEKFEENMRKEENANER